MQHRVCWPVAAFYGAVSLMVLRSSSAQVEPPSPSAARAPAFEAADVRTFVPTQSFGAATTMGLSGDWEFRDDEFVGTIGPDGQAALRLEGAYQDLALTATFRCDGACLPGILVRAESDGAVTEGVLYAFDESGAQIHRVAFGPNGEETDRNPLASSPSPYPASMLDFRAEYPGLGNYYAGELGAIQDITPLDVEETWNRAEIHVVGSSIRGILNGAGTSEAGLAGMGETGHGGIALLASGEPGMRIRFRDVALKGLDRKDALPPEVTSPRFRKLELEGMFYSEAVTSADVNLDGHPDVISGPSIFLGPDFTERQEIFTPHHYAPNEYPDPLLTSAGDLTGDGYPDVIQTGEPGRPGYLYVNPGREVRRWKKYRVIPSVDNEIAFLDDVDGDGVPEYVYGDGGYVGYAKPGEDPTDVWTFQPVSEQGPWGAMYAHGLGTGDVDGDGRTDIIQAYGWWEQPPEITGEPWTYHPEVFGRWGTQQGGPGGARAYAYDVDGDGLNDVVTSLEGHGFGLAWFEQVRASDGTISFVQHTIMDDVENALEGVSVAALHALTLADIDGDGLQDIVTGKRWWAHFGENPTDPDAFGAPVVYWFRLVRDGGDVRFEPELINNHSGVGTDMTAADLNGDGLADVMTSTRYGTIIFLSTGRSSP